MRDELVVGSDFPAMDREEPAGRTLLSMDLPDAVLADITWHNCFRFLGIDPPKLFSSREQHRFPRAGGPRAALSRLTRNGLLVTSKTGRRTFSRLSSRAAAILDDGARRIFSFGAANQPWDGCRRPTRSSPGPG